MRPLSILSLILLTLLLSCSNQQDLPLNAPRVTQPLVITVTENVTTSRHDLQPLRNELYYLESIQCEKGGEKFDLVLKNVGNRLVPIEGVNLTTTDLNRAIRVFVNGLPITHLSQYCQVRDLLPGSKAYCTWIPAQSPDAFVHINPLRNSIMIQEGYYTADLQMECGTSADYALRELRCSAGPDILVFGLANIFNQSVNLNDPEFKVSINGFALDHLSEYCATSLLEPGDDTQCRRTEFSPYDRSVRLQSGGTTINNIAVSYKGYAQGVSFRCE